MSSISVSTETKAEFDSLKPDSQTHDEFVETLLETYQAYQGEIPDHEEIAEKTADEMGPKIELSMKRVANELREELE